MSRPFLEMDGARLVFDGLEAVCWRVNLSEAVTGAEVKNISPGQIYTFIFVQDQAGGYAFPWPPQCLNAIAVDLSPGSVTVQNLIGITGGILIANQSGTWTEE